MTDQLVGCMRTLAGAKLVVLLTIVELASPALRSGASLVATLAGILSREADVATLTPRAH